jgi:hypothetical protein
VPWCRRLDRTSDDPGIVRLQLHRVAPSGSRTRQLADENPLVLRHDSEIYLSVREDSDDPSSDLHKYRVCRSRGVTGQAADFRVIGLRPPSIGNTGIDVKDYFLAVRLERDHQLAARRQPMLAKRGPQQITTVKPTALIWPVRIDRATAPLDAMRTPLAVRFAEFLYGHHLAAERAGTAASPLYDGWRHYPSTLRGEGRARLRARRHQAQRVGVARLRSSRGKPQCAPAGLMALY